MPKMRCRFTRISSFCLNRNSYDELVQHRHVLILMVISISVAIASGAAEYCKKPITAITENPSKQIIRLNCLLKNLVNGGKFLDALHLFKQTHSSDHLEPDNYTVSSALKACANIHDTVLGRQLHAHSIQSGLESFPHVTNTLLSLYAKSRDLVSVKRVFDVIKEPDVYSFTTLLSACTKLGEVDYACGVFDQMSNPNVAVWNAMITGCGETGYDLIAFDLFLQMHAMGVKADHYAFASILRYCSRDQFVFGRQVHSLIVKTGFLSKVSVVNSLLAFYFDFRNIDAYGVFEEAGFEVGNEITYNILIAGLVSMERYENALLMFKAMQSIGLCPTDLTFVNVMSACLIPKIAQQVHGQAIKMDFADYTVVSNAAISMYSNTGDLDAASLLFRRLEEKDIVSWNSIIASYAKENECKDAFIAYVNMQRNSIQPDEYTIGSLLSCSQLEVVEMIQATVVKNALIMIREVLNAFISAFSRNVEIKRARELFAGMQSWNLISWNAMISGFLMNGQPEYGLQYFSRLLLFGFRPNEFTLNHVLSICSSMSDLRHGKQVHAYILKLGYFSHTLLGNTLITMYSKCGSLHLSIRVFDTMTDKDTVSWNTVISAFAQHGNGKEAIQRFEAMQDSREVVPDKATFTAILSACSRSGLVADGLRIFNWMVNRHGFEPEAPQLSCIIDLLGKDGFFDTAEGMIKSLATGLDPSVLWTLFSLCAGRGHLRLGTFLAEFLLETGMDDPAVYVMMSNLHANAGKWEESANLRGLMKKSSVLKQPGSSWITS